MTPLDPHWGETPRDRLLAASLVPGVSARVAVPAVLADPDAVLAPPTLPPKARARWRAGVTDPAFARAIAAERAALDHLGAWFLTPADPDWPASLPPLGVLRGRGALPTDGLAIVGARRADAYGRELAARVAQTAVERGVAVVSGGAFGIDHAAHRAALDAGGRTVVVLGSGLTRPAPASHRALFDEARTRGAVVSPFPCAQGAARWTFPHRNAWIAGLSRAVVVVQASTRSGALHTARAALERGTPVHAIPGPFDAPLHAGCHALVGEGARLLTHPAGWAEDLARSPHHDPPAAPAAPADHRALWDAASAEARPLDALARAAGLDIDAAATAATLLELDGWLRPSAGGRYVQSRPG